MKKKILIVDDEESIRFAFEMILEDEGYEIFLATDYESAAENLLKISPDLVITDIILRGKTGIDLLERVRELEMNCPVIMITGQPNVETSAESVRLGAFDYIPKPIRREELLRKTALALRYKNTLDQKEQKEKENRQVRKNLESIIHSLVEGIVMVDDAMNVIKVNPTFETICGRTEQALSGQCFSREHMRCSAACLPILEQALKKQETVRDVQIECRHEEKEDQVVRLSSTPLEPDGVLNSGALLIVADITQQTSLKNKLKERQKFHRIIGKSKKMQEIFELMRSVSDLDSSVLITGETGTGKEMAANAIHANSPRKDKPFVKVNCSALSENILESELFGHVKGAFTGAIKDKIGRFEIAHNGTLFLDEIGDMSPLVQLKLLRVLQEKEFERVGDNRTIRTDVRIIAAAGSNFQEKILSGHFRKDLYYRIKVVNIKLPPLRERRDDIPLLAEHFVKKFNHRFNKRLAGCSTEVINAFMTYAWPGNIRELEHAVEHCFVLCRSGAIRFEHLPVEIKGAGHIPETGISEGPNKEEILAVLDRTDWNKAKTARLLGMGRRTLYRKLQKFKIDKPI